MKNIKYIFKTVALMAIVFSCNSNSEKTQEEERQELDSVKLEIEQLIATGTCVENSDCDFIAFGSKPCGGPWSYLVYSNSIDVELLKEKVNNYNKKESEFNIKWGIISDCMVEAPPSKVQCIQGDCTAIY